MSLGNGLSTDLMGLGLPAQQAVYVGSGAGTTLAGVGTSQSGAAAIVKGNTNVLATTASSQTAFVLPSDMELEVAYTVTNTSSTTALVFPFSGGAINAASGDASVSIAQNLARTFIRKSATRIISFLTA